MPPKTTEKTALRTQKWTNQEDVDITENLAHPNMHAKDYALLVFCAWLAIVVGAVCGQWVADEMLGHLFFATFWLICMGLWRLAGANFLWSVFLRRDVRSTQAKVGLVGGVLVGSCLLFWGAGILCWTYVDFWQVGVYHLMFPTIKGTTWKEVLYFMGVALFMIMEGVCQSVWWNVLYDNCFPKQKKSGMKWVMRFWGSLCMGLAMWCYVDPQWKGKWWWTWALIVACFKFVMTMACFVLYDSMSFGAALALRLGVYMATYLMWMGVYFQWWGLDWAVLQWAQCPGNLIDS